MSSRDLDRLPDARDGLTRLERIILWQIGVLREELSREYVPSAMLYGRVIEHMDVSREEFQAACVRLVER